MLSVGKLASPTDDMVGLRIEEAGSLLLLSHMVGSASGDALAPKIQSTKLRHAAT